MTVHIHPSIDNGVKKGSGSFAGGTLVCKCTDKPVKVGITGDVAHNHACGCTKCWKPDGRNLLGGRRGAARQCHGAGKRRQAADRRCVRGDPAHACKGCGTHMYGRIENKGHPFYGLDFIHPELFQEAGSAAPGIRGVRVVGDRVRRQAGSRWRESGRVSRSSASSPMTACRRH